MKGLLLCGTCDLPAKCLMMNMAQLNGEHGCIKCKQEGTVISIGKGHGRIFPFSSSLIDGPKRNHEEFISNGKKHLPIHPGFWVLKGHHGRQTSLLM